MQPPLGMKVYINQRRKKVKAALYFFLLIALSLLFGFDGAFISYQFQLLSGK